jgi:hypothetical protein
MASQEAIETQRAKLAAAMAAGISITKWSRDNEVSRRTAFNWASDPAFKARVERMRGRVVDQAIGSLTAYVKKAISTIARIAENGESDAVKLAAARAIVEKLIDVSSHVKLRSELEEMTKRLNAIDSAGPDEA